MLTADNGASCLFMSAQNGHLEVVRALLEAGGRELAMLTADDGASCLFVSEQNGHLEVVNAMLEAGGHLEATRNDSVLLHIFEDSEHLERARGAITRFEAFARQGQRSTSPSCCPKGRGGSH